MMPQQKELDVKKIIKPLLCNYDEHVFHFLHILEQIKCRLIYDGPEEFRDHIRDKKVYACSVQYSGGSTSKTRYLRSIFPVMIGSKLDIGIRKKKYRSFTSETLKKLVNICYLDDQELFEPPDIAVTFFVINGCLKQLPYFFTNDPTNTHVIKQNSIVRCYTYDADDRGKELSLYMDDIYQTEECQTHRRGRRQTGEPVYLHQRGDLIVLLNDGKKSTDTQTFFSHCPYPIDQEIYMAKLYQEGRFDIDHLANKIVVSPGHLFVKLFIKYLYLPLREGNWSIVKSKSAMVIKSIETGCLLHVLSRKTLYFKESGSAPKMVSTPRENHRELGQNGEIYVEKNTGCYRDVSLQTYPINPYLSHLIIRQISSKVKISSAAMAFHSSYVGFLCFLGTFETKNVGRTNIMARDTYVSTCYEMDPVARKKPGQELYDFLQLESGSDKYYVVVNEACIPVTKTCFHRISLIKLKTRFVFIECYQESTFIYIRYKTGLLFKKLSDKYWVTPRDEMFWVQKLFGFQTKEELIETRGYDYLTGHHVDLNPFFHHNAFPKNILAFNALKNAVLATDKSYSQYFMETVSAYMVLTPKHEAVCRPVDAFSQHFVLQIPRVTVAYMSFMGNNQEDCIIVNKHIRVFDCFRFYTLRFKWMVPNFENIQMVFYPVLGDAMDDDEFLGTLICHTLDENSYQIEVVPQSIHVKVVYSTPREVRLYFTKPPFKILHYNITTDRLSICVETSHPSSTGDKLCSFHGQKGVMRKSDTMPMFDETVIPDMLVNPYSLFRMTPGQIREGLIFGEGKDANIVYNSDGKLVPDAKAFYAKTFYFPIAYWSSEHIYAPKKNDCILDLILGQAVKGRSRGGGMRLGNMEVMNGMRGNGIAACFEEKLIEHSDRVLNEDRILLPKSAYLCREDARFFKCNLHFNKMPCIVEETNDIIK